MNRVRFKKIFFQLKLIHICSNFNQEIIHILLEIIKNLEILYDKKVTKEFPDKFQVNIDTLERGLIDFKKIEKDKSYPLASSNIYTINSANQIVKFEQQHNTEVSIKSICV